MSLSFWFSSRASGVGMDRKHWVALSQTLLMSQTALQKYRNDTSGPNTSIRKHLALWPYNC